MYTLRNVLLIRLVSLNRRKTNKIIKNILKKNKICLFKFSYYDAQEKFLINDAIESSKHIENKMLLHTENY